MRSLVFNCQLSEHKKIFTTYFIDNILRNKLKKGQTFQMSANNLKTAQIFSKLHYLC